MKAHMYFLAKGSEIISGPYFTIDAAIDAKKKLIAPIQPLVRVVKSVESIEVMDV